MTLLHIAYLHGMGRIYTRLPADTAGSRKECHLVAIYRQECLRGIAYCPLLQNVGKRRRAAES